MDIGGGESGLTTLWQLESVSGDGRGICASGWTATTKVLERSESPQGTNLGILITVKIDD